MQLIIHRGTNQIGGNCIELSAGNKRLILDLGLPLDTPIDDNIDDHMPKTLRRCFNDPQSYPLAIILSHAHIDHYGLLRLIPNQIPVYCSAATEILINSSGIFSDGKPLSSKPSIYKTNQPFELSPFKITPKLMDHSAFDAHGFLIEAMDRSIFYTGDFRSHGRKSKLMQMFLKNPPSADVLLMEGTVLSDRINELMVNEDELESRFIQCINDSSGLVLVTTSSQNIDRLVTIFRSAVNTGRKLAIDIYTAHVLDSLIDHRKIPKSTWPRIRVVFSKPLAEIFETAGLEKVLHRLRSQAVRWDRIAMEPSKWVLLAKPGLRGPIRKYLSDILPDTTWIYSLWKGYLKREGSMKSMSKELEDAGVKFIHIHTGGHARKEDLENFVKALKPKVLIPVHTERPDMFKSFHKNVVMLKDGQHYNL